MSSNKKTEMEFKLLMIIAIAFAHCYSPSLMNSKFYEKTATNTSTQIIQSEKDQRPSKIVFEYSIDKDQKQFLIKNDWHEDYFLIIEDLLIDYRMPVSEILNFENSCFNNSVNILLHYRAPPDSSC